MKVLFPDVPEAWAEGKDEDEAMARAKEALEHVLRRRMIEDGKIPPPSDIRGAPTIRTDMFVIQETSSDWDTPISGGRY
jgi:hypothetical protein